jgi:hypothetical protein
MRDTVFIVDDSASMLERDVHTRDGRVYSRWQFLVDVVEVIIGVLLLIYFMPVSFPMRSMFYFAAVGHRLELQQCSDVLCRRLWPWPQNSTPTAWISCF